MKGKTPTARSRASGAPKRTQRHRSDQCTACHQVYCIERDVRLMEEEHPHCKRCHQTTDNMLNLKARL